MLLLALAQAAQHHVGGVPSLLHRGGCEAGHRLAAPFVAKRREVADDERLGMPGNRQVRLDQHAPGAVERQAESARQRRSGDSGGPQHGVRASRPPPRFTPRASTFVTGCPQSTLTPSRRSEASAFCERRWGTAVARAGHPR